MNTALLVIDFINDIVSPEGKIPSAAAHVAQKSSIQHANRAITYAREHGWLVIHVKVAFAANYLEQPKNSPIFGKANQFQALKLGDWGTEFHRDLDVQPATDCVVIKSRVSPFYGTELEAILRANKIERLVICGVSTTWAIQACARDGHDRDYQLVLLEDACGAASEEEHQQSIKQLSRICQVISVAEINKI